MNPTLAKLRATSLRTRIVAVTAVVVVSTYLTLPELLARNAIEDELVALGAEEVTIGHLAVSPFLGTIQIAGLRARGATGELSLDLLEADLALLALLDHRVVVQALTLDGLSTAVELGEGRTTVGPLAIEHAAGGEDDSAEDGADAWGLGLTQLTVEDVDVPLTLDGRSYPIRIHALRLTDLATWNPADGSPIELRGSVAGADVAIVGETSPLDSSRAATAQVDLTDLDLAPFVQLLPESYHAAALRVDSLEGQAQFRLRDGQLFARYDGALALSAVDLPLAEGMRLRYATSRWEGVAGIDLFDGVMDFAGEVEVSELLAELEGRDIAADQLSWAGDGRVLIGERLVVDVAGQARAAGAQIDIDTDPPLSIAAEALELDSEFDEEGIKDADAPWPIHAELDAEGMTAALKGSMRFIGLGGGLAGFSVERVGRVRFDGEMVLAQQGGETRSTQEGTLAVEQPRVADPLLGVSIGAESLLWQGASQLDLDADGGQSIRAAGDANIRQGYAERTDGSGLLGRSETLAINGLRASNDGSFAYERLRADGIVVGRPEGREPLMAISSASVEGLSLEPPELRIGPTVVADLVVTLLRDADGSVPGAQLFQLGPDVAEEEPEDGGPADLGGATVAVQSFEVSGDSHILVRDAVLIEGRTLDATIDRLSLGNVAAAETTQAELDLALSFPGYATVTMAGPVGLDRGEVFLDVGLVLRQLQLPTWSAALERAVAHHVNHGSLDADAHISLDQRQLDVTSELLIRRLDVEQIDPALAREYGANTTIPLQFGLMLLKDGDGNIELDLPVSGNLDDPDFDFTDAVWSAVGTAAASGAELYLKLALGPWGAALILTDLVRAQDRGIPLEDVLFVRGTAEPDGDYDEYAERVLGIMAERPEMELRICGIAVPSDAPPTPEGEEPAPLDREALTELARQRGLAIQRAAIERQGIDPARLHVCRPRVDEDPDALPRAELSF